MIQSTHLPHRAFDFHIVPGLQSQSQPVLGSITLASFPPEAVQVSVGLAQQLLIHIANAPRTLEELGEVRGILGAGALPAGSCRLHLLQQALQLFLHLGLLGLQLERLPQAFLACDNQPLQLRRPRLKWLDHVHQLLKSPRLLVQSRQSPPDVPSHKRAPFFMLAKIVESSICNLHFSVRDTHILGVLDCILQSLAPFGPIAFRCLQ
mmetsp:Transcript_37900/g.95152  ORF Transcript_37900/g.95152 Transcript_37900/m.95152 type:complete len:207 (+) Transcript_37900:491-1111(+)